MRHIDEYSRQLRQTMDEAIKTADKLQKTAAKHRDAAHRATMRKADKQKKLENKAQKMAEKQIKAIQQEEQAALLQGVIARMKSDGLSPASIAAFLEIPESGLNS